MWKNYRLKGGDNEYAELLLVGFTEKDWVDFWTGHLRHFRMRVSLLPFTLQGPCKVMDKK